MKFPGPTRHSLPKWPSWNVRICQQRTSKDRQDILALAGQLLVPKGGNFESELKLMWSSSVALSPSRPCHRRARITARFRSLRAARWPRQTCPGREAGAFYVKL